jgi:hypothetical protein
MKVMWTDRVRFCGETCADEPDRMVALARLAVLLYLCTLLMCKYYRCSKSGCNF